MDIVIRNDLQVGDIGSIVYLHGVLYAQEYGYDHSFEAYVAEPLGQFARGSNLRERIWVVESNNEVLGSIALCEVSKTQAQLRWFLLSPKLRGHGLGKKLISQLLNFAKAKHYQTVSLWTVKGLDVAKHLYLATGFSLTKEVEHVIWGSVHTEQEYTMAIDAYEQIQTTDNNSQAAVRPA